MKSILSSLLRMFIFDHKAILRVSKHKQVGSWALAIVVIASFAVSPFLWAQNEGKVIGFLQNPTYIALFAIAFYFVLLGLVHFFALRFGGKGTYKQLFHVMGVGSALTLFNIIPFIGSVISRVWSLLLEYHAIRSIYGLSSGRAIGVVLSATFSSMLIAALLLWR